MITIARILNIAYHFALGSLVLSFALLWYLNIPYWSVVAVLSLLVLFGYNDPVKHSRHKANYCAASVAYFLAWLVTAVLLGYGERIGALLPLGVHLLYASALFVWLVMWLRLYIARITHEIADIHAHTETLRRIIDADDSTTQG